LPLVYEELRKLGPGDVPFVVETLAGLAG
jgi:hypothetical protein